MIDKLLELRIYATQPGMCQVLHDQWESDHHAIYADFHTVLGSFDALDRNSAEAGAGDELGIAVFMQHDDRTAVDASMNALIASNRMNEVAGPPGRSIVDHWERTFLYPLTVATDLADGDRQEPGVYEMRTFTYTGDAVSDAAEYWTSTLYPAFAERYHALGLFVAHPETSDMPTGIAVLIRHADLQVANKVAGPSVPAELDELVPGGGALRPTGCARQLLRPLLISDMQ